MSGVHGAAGVATIARKKNAAAGGLTTTPSWIAVGTKGTGTNNDCAPAYGTNAAGDLFLMQVYIRNVTSGLSAPSGWSLRDGPDTLGNSSTYWLTRNTRSTGSESGTVTLTAAGNSIIAKIHTFRNVNTDDSAAYANLTAGGNGTNDTTAEAPTVAAPDVHYLAVAMGGSSDDLATCPSFTGESGGDWTRVDSDTSTVGNDCAIWCQTAALDSGGAISGGSATFDNSSSENWVQHGFALKGV